MSVLKEDMKWVCVKNAQTKKNFFQDILATQGAGFFIFICRIGGDMHQAKGLVFEGWKNGLLYYKRINIKKKNISLLKQEALNQTRGILKHSYKKYGKQIPTPTFQTVLLGFQRKR